MGVYKCVLTERGLSPYYLYLKRTSLRYDVSMPLDYDLKSLSYNEARLKELYFVYLMQRYSKVKSAPNMVR